MYLNVAKVQIANIFLKLEKFKTSLSFYFNGLISIIFKELLGSILIRSNAFMLNVLKFIQPFNNRKTYATIKSKLH